MPDRVELTHQAIDPAAVLTGLAETRDGAVDLFLGVVRDHHDGQRVVRLEYHAYPEMALKVMRDIVSEGHERFGVSSFALIHRLGTLEIGEIAVAQVFAPQLGGLFIADHVVTQGVIGPFAFTTDLTTNIGELTPSRP